MSVRPIDIMMVPQMNEVSHIKQSENMSLMLKKRAAMNMSEVEAVHIQSVLLRKAMLL